MSAHGAAAGEVRAHLETKIADRYAVERLLGQGGMGAVYAVIDSSSGARVALKRLLAKSSSRAAGLFEREYQTLASLRHPGIVEVYDYGRDTHGAYYTMELIEGSDLAKLAPIGWREACAYLREVASILGLLHARKLVHRDLSPRNLLRLPNGNLKLIDFGALAPFGVSTETVGTPPFVPPETLRGGMLDERSDLFALGALGHWLITGVHAYPARQLRELPALWERAPAAASSLVALLQDPRLEPVPRALDELLGALLRVSPAERPRSTTELIDRLNAVADLEPETQAQAAQGYLNSQVFVGRERERERVLAALPEAQLGRGLALLLEGEPGVGRTRFLAEAAVLARLAGLLTLTVDARHGQKPYAAANALCLAALAAQPELTRELAEKDAPVLGRMSEALHERLGGGKLLPTSGTPGEDRALTQNALFELFLALSRRRPLALLVDDLHALDEESQGLFASLAHSANQSPLLLLASAARHETHEPKPAVLSYRGAATRLHLLALTGPETLELLRSVFGSVAYLERCAERLQRASGGSPAYCLELAEHLVRSGAAHYQDGAWVLPAELSADGLPASRHAAYLARITRLTSETRKLARLLSVPHRGVLTHEQCVTLAKLGELPAEESLAELLREGILQRAPLGFRFAHAELSTALNEELVPSERARAHRTLGELVLLRAGDSQDERLLAAVHFLRADLPGRAYPLILTAAQSFTGAELNSALRVAAPLFEEIHELLLARGADLYARAVPLSILALAGYFIDRRYAARYGDQAVAAMSSLLKLELARTLSRFLGKKLGLIVTLIIAGLNLRLHSRRGPTLPVAIRYLLSVCSALAGTSACCIDPRRAARLASVIEPLKVFGPDHAASIVHRFTMAMSYIVQDRPAFTNGELRSLIARLESERPIKALDPGIRLNYIAGAYFSLGVNEAWREGTGVLDLADRLERFSPLYAMSADHLRENYHSRQGNVERAEHYRQRVELHAVQLGSAWQVETWAPAHFTETALRTNDAMLMKRGVQELSRLAAEIPSLGHDEEHARGTYLMLRGKYREAIPLLDSRDEPLAVVGYIRTRGSLARCHNALGQHERAREVCMAALALLSPEDLTYAVMNLSIQVELIHADAGLGDTAAARARLDALLAQFGGCGDPLTIGQLHAAYVRIATAMKDFATAHAQLELLEQQYRPTGIPSLLQLLTNLSRALHVAEHPNEVAAGTTGAGPRLLDDASHLMTRVQLVLSHGGGAQLDERAGRGLQVALELSSADEGFVVLQGERGGAEVHLGSAPTRELLSWAKQQLHAASFDDQTVMTEEVDSQIDSNYLVVGRMRYCAATLSAPHQGQDVVVGTLVLGFDGRVPRMPDANVLSLIAGHLAI